MSACEKCWSDAYLLKRVNGKDQVDNYNFLIKQRVDSPCTPEDQAGQFWDKNLKQDKRIEGHNRKA